MSTSEVEVKTGGWAQEDDDIIVELQAQHGKKLSKIAREQRVAARNAEKAQALLNPQRRSRIRTPVTSEVASTKPSMTHADQRVRTIYTCTTHVRVRARARASSFSRARTLFRALCARAHTTPSTHPRTHTHVFTRAPSIGLAPAGSEGKPVGHP